MEKLLVGVLVLWILTIVADISLTLSLEKKCKDAGGVYVTSAGCINPSAVIEVN
jgi:hypothetical protein